MTPEEQDKELDEFDMVWGEYHNQLYGHGDKYSLAKFYWFESRRLLRNKLRKVTTEVVNNLLKQQEDLDPKIVEFVSKNFWDLI